MTKAILISFICFLGIIDVNSHAQSTYNQSPSSILKECDNVTFGKDIIINEQSDQSQQTVAICSAFNGWLFCAYSYIDSYENFPHLVLLKSTDNGLTWLAFEDEPWANPGYKFTTLDIITTGDTLPDCKLIVAGVTKLDPYDIGGAFVIRLNGETGLFESYLVNEYLVYDIDLVSDFEFPASNSFPSSLGIIYSKYSSTIDSLIFRSSDDGGLTLNNRKTLTVTGNGYRLCNVTLTYGRSLNFPNGNYFAAWDEHIGYGVGSVPGNLYTAHTYPDFQSPFTPPVCLDSLDPQNIAMCRNPVIVCQASNYDNDSANITEVIVFEKYIEASNRWELEGCYNLQSTTSSYFQRFDISDNNDLLFQPDLAFIPENSSFYLTYYDSTASKLPLLTQGVNMPTPDNWNTASTDYHDLFSLVAPRPKLGYNFEKEDVMMVWEAKRSNGNKAALFDAPYSVYTDIGVSPTDQNSKIYPFPNPADNHICIKGYYRGNLIISNLQGEVLIKLLNYELTSSLDISQLSKGVYIVKILTINGMLVGKFIKN